jgi:hypothetical protein
MTQKGVKLEIETIEECGCEPHECYCRHNKEYKKSMKIRDLTTMVGLIDTDAPPSFRALERICELKKKIKRIDPEWILIDEVKLLEHQVLSQLDIIDHTIPWNSARNKLRYIDLCQTINKLKIIHPDWEMDLKDSKNHYLCRCCSCLEERRLYQQTLDEIRSEKSTPSKGSRDKFSN